MSIASAFRQRNQPGRRQLREASLALEAIDRSGAIVRADGGLVRVMRVTPVNPALLSAAEAHRLAAGFVRLLDELDRIATLQFYVEGGAVRDKPVVPSFYVVVPSPARGAARPRRRRPAVMVRRALSGRREALRASLLDVEAVRARLRALGLDAHLVDGPGVARLLMRRFDPVSAAGDDSRPIEVLGELDEVEEAESAARAATDLQDRLALRAPHFGARHVDVGRNLEQIVYVASALETTSFAWLLGPIDGEGPCTLSIHVHAQRVPGALHRGRRPSEPDAPPRAAVSIYYAIREPGPDASLTRLAERADAAAAALEEAAAARVHRGEFRQRALWTSMLPVGDDAAGFRHDCASQQLGATFPVVTAACSSPIGVPLGWTPTTRRRELLDPFDPLHQTSALLLSGNRAASAGRALMERLAAGGLHTATVDAAGDRATPAMSRRLGDDVHVNPWDTMAPAAPSADKLGFLLALHELLVGGSEGFAAPTHEVLASAIRAVYAHAEREGHVPLERDLVRELSLAADRVNRSLAERLHALGSSLHELCRAGPTAELLDRPTTLDAETANVVVDVGSLPEPFRCAAALIAGEHLSVPRTRPAAGAALLLVDAGRLAASRAGAAWLALLARSARRRGLFVVATTERLTDFATPVARAAFRAFSLRLALRDDDQRLPGARAALGLGEREVQEIVRLPGPEPGPAHAYWINGMRGRAVVALGVGETAGRRASATAGTRTSSTGGHHR